MIQETKPNMVMSAATIKNLPAKKKWMSKNRENKTNRIKILLMNIR